MVPLIDVAEIEKNSTCGDAVRLATEKSYIQVPVYEERGDRIVGVLHVLELLGVDPDTPLMAYVKPAHYVPGFRSIKELLIDMRRSGDVISVVVDEFGGADGIVCLEDILEEVVEEIEDEYGTNQTST